MAQLIPDPHFIKSPRARNWNLTGALDELVDNALGHGQAKNVEIVVSNTDGIMIKDNGVGVEDLNRLFTFGVGSSYADLTQIGQFGVGAKNAMIWLGDVCAVATVKDGRFKMMEVNWADCERRGVWPEAYDGKDRAAKKDEVGTHVFITKLARNFHLSSTETLADHLSFQYAPGLRHGIVIKVTHQLKSGARNEIDVNAFAPTLEDETKIEGAITLKDGTVLRWSGRAGLSDKLTERQSGVHIGFGYRVIETTTEPFGGKSAPSLYVEVDLNTTDPWKYALSEHKDRLMDHRKELFANIHGTIRSLIAKASARAEYVMLLGVVIPIEAKLNRMLKGAGILVSECEDAESEFGGVRGGPAEEPEPGPGEKKVKPKDDGDPAKPKPPTGLKIEPWESEKLDGKLYSWLIDDSQLVVRVDKQLFEQTFGWPPNHRDQSLIQLMTSYLSHGIEADYRAGQSTFRSLGKRLREQIESWGAATKNGELAPKLNRLLLQQSSSPVTA